MQTFADELSLRLAAFVKSVLVGSDHLPELSFEKGLFELPTSFPEVEMDTLESYANVRSVVEKIIKDVPQEFLGNAHNTSVVYPILYFGP